MVAASAIVGEVLGEHNYVNWSSCVQCYLVAKDLWEIVENDIEPKKEDTEAYAKWRKKNAMASHAIRISCSPGVLSQIRNIRCAKQAWDLLAKLHNPLGELASRRQGSSKLLGGSSADKPTPDGKSNSDYKKYEPLIKAFDRGNWHGIEQFFEEKPEALKEKIAAPGLTALQVAVLAQHVEVLQKLVEKVGAEGLEEKDELAGMTSLALAASGGNVQIAKCIIEKNKTVVSLRDNRGFLPVVHASSLGHKEMTCYLYSATPIGELHPNKGRSGATLLIFCIVTQIFDVALDLLEKHPRLAVEMAPDLGGITPIFLLSSMPSLFHSGCNLLFWQRWIYSWIHVPQDHVSDLTDVSIQQPRKDEYYGGNTRVEEPSLLHGLASNLLKPLGIKKIHDKKLMHTQAGQLLNCICKVIKDLDHEELEKASVDLAILQAVKNGIVEFIVEIIKANQQLLWSIDVNGRGIFFTAILSRQENIFSLLYGLDHVRMMNTIFSLDRFNNNMLHMAGMLSPSHRLDCISGAALQMQRELQWFEEVESIVQPISKDTTNADGKTPRDLFTESHANMVKEGEKWMKEIATSSTVAAALIVTIMFAAAFTVPGGNNENTGTPIFLGKNLFMVFIISDAISLFSATTSLLMFLGILTSRYAENKFLIRLPTKLIIGLSTLFFSIAAMMITFCAALAIMLEGKINNAVIISIILLASVPVTLFALLQFPLLFEIFVSTYGPGIFNRKTKRWY